MKIKHCLQHTDKLQFCNICYILCIIGKIFALQFLQSATSEHSSMLVLPKNLTQKTGKVYPPPWCTHPLMVYSQEQTVRTGVIYRFYVRPKLELSAGEQLNIPGPHEKMSPGAPVGVGTFSIAYLILLSRGELRAPTKCWAPLAQWV